MADEILLHDRFLPLLDRLSAAEEAPAEGPDRVERRIRRNVIDVLRRMFVLYHSAVHEGAGRPELLALDESLPPERRVAAAFERFARTLRQPWDEQAKKDARFGRDEAARKERLKLEAHDAVMAAWTAARQETDS